MDIFPNRKLPDYKVIDFIRKREIQESIAQSSAKKLQVTDNFISRLGLEKELAGHSGCVNCLEWNESGQILASASDDMHIVLWDPFRYKKKLVFHSGHYGNIFTIKFMPKSSDSIVVSGAGDFKVRVHDITLWDTILVCNCHVGRVKRIATAPSTPFLFWSAAEDGIIMQYDIRTPHPCGPDGAKKVLVNLMEHVGRFTEAKCIAVNPRREELIAVGANDAYIRMYDRRMIRLSQRPASIPLNNARCGQSQTHHTVPRGCAQYFIAGHLRRRDHCKKFSTTYLTFSNDGNELLVNMGGEQIYLFDIDKQGNNRTFTVAAEHNHNNKESSKYEICEDYSIFNDRDLTPEVEDIKHKANENFELQKYTCAINLYNKAIYLCSTSAVLYANRAAAYMKRNWGGDVSAALRDCRLTLLLDPKHVKAHFRLARCLYHLERYDEACIVLNNFLTKFSKHANNTMCRALKTDIDRAIDSGKEYATTFQMKDLPISQNEKDWREDALDCKMRFCGHCNTTTDIKEANFFGNNGQYIVAGSDDGSFFVWDRCTTNIVRALRGDERIVNCLQPHPSTCLLATSGIDPVIRLWSPLPEDGTANPNEVENSDLAAWANQIRMNCDPFEQMLRSMGYHLTPGETSSTSENEDIEEAQRLNYDGTNCQSDSNVLP